MTPGVLPTGPPLRPDDIAIAPPTLADGAAMWGLARAAGLDRNSQYHYLLFCRDFVGTSAAAHAGAELVGFVTAYIRPDARDTLFVWQIGVAPDRHGQRIGSRLLDHLFGRVVGCGVTRLEATVTPDNVASLALFSGFAARHDLELRPSALFPSGLFAQPHQEEVLVRLEPA